MAATKNKKRIHQLNNKRQKQQIQNESTKSGSQNGGTGFIRETRRLFESSKGNVLQDPL
jgi:hypothetical protein